MATNEKKGGSDYRANPSDKKAQEQKNPLKKQGDVRSKSSEDISTRKDSEGSRLNKDIYKGDMGNQVGLDG